MYNLFENLKFLHPGKQTSLDILSPGLDIDISTYKNPNLEAVK